MNQPIRPSKPSVRRRAEYLYNLIDSRLLVAMFALRASVHCEARSISSRLFQPASDSTRKSEIFLFNRSEQRRACPQESLLNGLRDRPGGIRIINLIRGLPWTLESGSDGEDCSSEMVIAFEYSNLKFGKKLIAKSSRSFESEVSEFEFKKSKQSTKLSVLLNKASFGLAKITTKQRVFIVKRNQNNES